MMTVATPVGGQRNARNVPYEVQRGWSHGLYNCCSGGMGTCTFVSVHFACRFTSLTPLPFHITGCAASWCPCVVYGKNKRRLEYLARHNDPDPEHGGCCSGDCWLHCGLVTLCGLGALLQVRSFPLSSLLSFRCLLAFDTFLSLLPRSDLQPSFHPTLYPRQQ